jgi:matrix metalloproteinase-14 (membrane-inserted)
VLKCCPLSFNTARAGSQYWKFINQQPQPSYPKDLSVGFPGIPSNLDAAFVWGGNGKIYVVKDQLYWKYDFDSKPHVRYRREA